MNYLIKTGVFSLVGNYLRPSNNYRQVSFNINAVVLILIVCKDLRNWNCPTCKMEIRTEHSLMGHLFHLSFLIVILMTSLHTG